MAPGLEVPAGLFEQDSDGGRRRSHCANTVSGFQIPQHRPVSKERSVDSHRHADRKSNCRDWPEAETILTPYDLAFSPSVFRFRFTQFQLGKDITLYEQCNARGWPSQNNWHG